MAKVAAVAKLVAKEGKLDELVELMKKIWPSAEEEAGTEVYVMHTAEPSTVLYYLLFSDEEAFGAHMGGAHVQAAMGQFDTLLAEPLELIQATPIFAKGAKV